MILVRMFHGMSRLIITGQLVKCWTLWETTRTSLATKCLFNYVCMCVCVYMRVCARSSQADGVGPSCWVVDSGARGLCHGPLVPHLLPIVTPPEPHHDVIIPRHRDRLLQVEETGQYTYILLGNKNVLNVKYTFYMTVNWLWEGTGWGTRRTFRESGSLAWYLDQTDTHIDVNDIHPSYTSKHHHSHSWYLLSVTSP